MRSQIKRILAQHGELTFRQLCAAMNCYTADEIEHLEQYVHGCCDPIGEAPLIGSTILRKKLVEPPTVPQARYSDVMAFPA